MVLFTFSLLSQDLLPAMKALGISPNEQEVVDMQCEMEKRWGTITQPLAAILIWFGAMQCKGKT